MQIHIIVKIFDTEECLCRSIGYFTDLKVAQLKVDELEAEHMQSLAKLHGFETVDEYLKESGEGLHRYEIVSLDPGTP